MQSCITRAWTRNGVAFRLLFGEWRFQTIDGFNSCLICLPMQFLVRCKYKMQEGWKVRISMSSRVYTEIQRWMHNCSWVLHCFRSAADYNVYTRFVLSFNGMAWCDFPILHANIKFGMCLISHFDYGILGMPRVYFWSIGSFCQLV